MRPLDILSALQIDHDPRLVPTPSGEAPPGVVVSSSPATLEPIAALRLDDATSCESAIAEASAAFRRWREVPAPVRGQVVRAIAEQLRAAREPLGALISLEVG